MSTFDWINAIEEMKLPRAFFHGSRVTRWKIAIYINRWIVKKYGNESPEKFLNDPEVLRMIKIKRVILDLFEEEWKSWIFHIYHNELYILSNEFNRHRIYIKFFLAFKSVFCNLEKGLIPSPTLSYLDVLLSSDDNLYKTGFIEEYIQKIDNMSSAKKFTFITDYLNDTQAQALLNESFYHKLKGLIFHQ